jgi:hypothetical protein
LSTANGICSTFIKHVFIAHHTQFHGRTRQDKRLTRIQMTQFFHTTKNGNDTPWKQTVVLWCMSVPYSPEPALDKMPRKMPGGPTGAQRRCGSYHCPFDVLAFRKSFYSWRHELFKHGSVVGLWLDDSCKIVSFITLFGPDANRIGVGAVFYGGMSGGGRCFATSTPAPIGLIRTTPVPLFFGLFVEEEEDKTDIL